MSVSSLSPRKKFGEGLRYFRNSSKTDTGKPLSQGEFSKLLEKGKYAGQKISVQTVSNWEIGKQAIPHDFRDLLMDVLTILVQQGGLAKQRSLIDDFLRRGNYPALNEQEWQALLQTEIHSLSPTDKSSQPEPSNAPAKKGTIFLSYKVQDNVRNAWVDKFYRDLRKIGFDVKLYNYEVAIGQSFSDFIISEIRDCNYFLFVITPEAVNTVESGKGALAFEMQIANARRMQGELKIIPIFREGNHTSTYLLDHRYLDFRDDKEYDLKFSELCQWLGNKIQPPPLGEHIFESERDSINHARMLTRTARNDFNQKNYSVAREKLQIAIHLDTEDNATWALWGRTLTNLGEFQEAIFPLTRAIKHTAFVSNRKLYLKVRSVANYFAGKYEDSLADAQAILAINSKDKEAHRLKATARLALGDIQQALEEISVLTKSLSYFAGHAIQALILLKMGENAAALEQIQTCVRIQPKDSVDLYCFALVYATVGDHDLAFELLEKSIRYNIKCLPRAKVDPLLAGLRQNARFEELTTLQNFPDKAHETDTDQSE